MEQAAAYVRTLCCGALICAILLQFGSGRKELQRMICGMSLAVLAISPLKKLEFRGLSRELDACSRAAESAAYDGREQAEKALTRDISDRCRAYILDKAAQMGLEVRADVEVDGQTHLPVGITLTGTASRRDGEQLQEVLERELGVKREAIRWIPPS